VVKRLALPVHDMVRDYHEGASLEILSGRYGVAVGTVRSRLIETGVALRRRGAPRASFDFETVGERCRRKSQRQLARELGVSRATVQRRLTEATHRRHRSRATDAVGNGVFDGGPDCAERGVEVELTWIENAT